MLQPGAARYIRGVAESKPLSHWCGLRPCTSDGLPILGWSPRTRGLLVATGHAMMGYWLAPVTGELTAQLVVGDTPSVDLEPMRVGRPL